MNERIDTAEIRRACAAATPGTWSWEQVGGAKGPILVARPGGFRVVMDFVRAGMDGGTLRLARRSAEDRGGVMFKPTEAEAQEHPDARFIALSRTALPAALDEIDALRAENERLSRAVRWAEDNLEHSDHVEGDVCERCELDVITGRATPSEGETK